MTRISPDLERFLKETSAPRQVLLVVKHGRSATSQQGKSYHTMNRQRDIASRSHLIQALVEEREHDARVEFDAVGMFDKIALRAPAEVIFKIARRQDVVNIILDEPTQVIDDLDW